MAATDGVGIPIGVLVDSAQKAERSRPRRRWKPYGWPESMGLPLHAQICLDRLLQ